MMIRINRPHSKRPASASRRGSALLASMVFVMLVAGMGVCMVQLHNSQSRRQELSIDKKRAIYIAEAGLAEAFFSVAQGKSGAVASPEIPAQVGDGYYWVEAEQLLDGQVSLTCTGLSGRGRFSINSVLQRQTDPVASLGVFSATSVTIGKDSIIDGYSSGEGDFASQVDGSLGNGSTGEGARITAGTDIILEGAAGGGGGPMQVGDPSGTTVYGDVSPGASGTLTLGTGVTVSGSTRPSGDAPTLEEIDVPVIPSATDPSFDGVRVATVATGSYTFDTIAVPAGKSLTVEGPATVVVGKLAVEQGSSFIADTTNGCVKVYVTEQFSFASGSIVDNTAEDPTGLIFMVAADEWADFDGDRIADNPVEFSPTGDLFGYIYAPTIDFELQAETHLIGGIAANSVAIAEGSHITFDVALTTTEVVFSGLPLQVAWRQCDIPNVPICRSPMDPKSYLTINAVTPVASADAHAEKYIKIQYAHTDGTRKSYTGLASGFDWSVVKSATAVLWDDDVVVDKDDGQDEYTPTTFTSAIKVVRAVAGKDG